MSLDRLTLLKKIANPHGSKQNRAISSTHLWSHRISSPPSLQTKHQSSDSSYLSLFRLSCFFFFFVISPDRQKEGEEKKKKQNARRDVSKSPVSREKATKKRETEGRRWVGTHASAE